MSMPPKMPGLDTTALDRELKKLFEGLDKRFSSVDQVVRGIDLKIKGSPISKSVFRDMTHDYSKKYGLLEYKSKVAIKKARKIVMGGIGFSIGILIVILFTTLLYSVFDISVLGTKATPKEESLLIMTVPADDNSSSNKPMFREIK